MENILTNGIENKLEISKNLVKNNYFNKWKIIEQ